MKFLSSERERHQYCIVNMLPRALEEKACVGFRILPWTTGVRKSERSRKEGPDAGQHGLSVIALDEFFN